MKRWWLIIALLLSVGLNVGILASRALQKRSAAGTAARDRIENPIRDEDRLPRVVYRMADELGLEGEKRDAFVEIQRAFFQQTIAARGRMARLQHEVRREITSDDPDRQTLDEILSELSQAHGDLERAFITSLLDSRDLLDADQEKHYRRYLRRMRHVRSEVERRFRERWRDQAERWQRDPRQRRRFGPGGLRDQPRGRQRENTPSPSEPSREDSENR